MTTQFCPHTTKVGIDNTKTNWHGCFLIKHYWQKWLIDQIWFMDYGLLISAYRTVAKIKSNKECKKAPGLWWVLSWFCSRPGEISVYKNKCDPCSHVVRGRWILNNHTNYINKPTSLPTPTKPHLLRLNHCHQKSPVLSPFICHHSMKKI